MTFDPDDTVTRAPAFGHHLISVRLRRNEARIGAAPAQRTTPRPAAKCRIAAVISLGALAACDLPQFGPTHGSMVSQQAAAEGNFALLEGPVYIATRNSAPSRGGFPAAFLAQSPFNTDIVAPGDQFALTIFENVPDGVFATSGNRIYMMESLQVSQAGKIVVPYVGPVHATGRSVESLRQTIAEALARQTPDPQVILTRVPGAGASVSLMGAVGQQGVLPIEVSTTRLSEMIARAGGPTEPLDEIMVHIERGGQRGTARLSYIAEDPRQNIALRPGDRVTLVRSRQSIAVLGAVGAQARVPVTQQDYRLIDLLADVGGLNGNFANPKGIFVYRTEANAQQIIRFDLSDPSGIFAARNFFMRDDDTVYISEAPIRNAQKVINTLVGVANSTESLTSVGK